MSLQVGFSAHSKEILAAYNAVRSDDQGIEWVVYTYDKGTNDLKVAEKGNGLEDLSEEFSDGKVQYAFARVLDPNTELSKFVLVGWCGSGVPESKKGLFNSHFNDVSKFLKGYHVQINARYEADVDPAFIMKRVTESSGSKYSTHKEAKRPEPAIIPARSVYTKTEVPDIGAMQREAMKKEPVPAPVRSVYQPVQTNPKPLAGRWGTHQQNDQARIEQLRTERESAERAVREREEQHQRQREQKAKVQADKEQQEITEKAIKEKNERARIDLEKQERAAREAEERKKREQAEQERIERLRNETRERERREQAERERIEHSHKEAEERALRDLEALQLREKQEKAESDEQERARAHEAEKKLLRQQEAAKILKEEEEARRRSEEEAARRQREEEEAARIQAELEESSARAAHAAAAVAADDIEPSYVPGTVSAVVLFSYDAAESNEISLAEGEIIINIEQVDDGWWEGTSEDGKRSGLFPANYVQLLEHENPPQPSSEPAPGTYDASVAHANDELGNTAIAIYDYIAGEENEISFAENDLIVRIEFVSDDWWQGQAPNGAVGLFPSNHVELR